MALALAIAQTNNSWNCRWPKGRTVSGQRAGHPRWRDAPNANSSTAMLQAGIDTPKILPNPLIKANHLRISRRQICYKFEVIAYNELSTYGQGT